jgi:hypothetical protein
MSRPRTSKPPVLRLAGLLVAGSLLALALAPSVPAKPRYLRFAVSVQGQQTANWSATDSGECGTTRGGSQTISFESVRPARLSLRRFPRTDPRTGKRRDFTFFGIDAIPTNWTFTRTYHQTTPPGCPPPGEEPEIVAAQARGCGTQGPFEVPTSVGWRGTAKPGDERGGTVELRGILDRRAPGQRYPSYTDCPYDGTHIADLIDSKGRLAQRRLTSRRRGAIRVKVSAREELPESESGSQTTTLAATVTLRRIRGSS